MFSEIEDDTKYLLKISKKMTKNDKIVFLIQDDSIWNIIGASEQCNTNYLLMGPFITDNTKW